MNTCHYCGARRAIGADPRPLPPGGAEVETLLRNGKKLPLIFVYLICGPCPVSERDALKLTRWYCEEFGPGAAMGFPTGDNPGSYRWPPVPHVMVYGPDLNSCEKEALTWSLIRCGVEQVSMLSNRVPPFSMPSNRAAPL